LKFNHFGLNSFSWNKMSNCHENAPFQGQHEHSVCDPIKVLPFDYSCYCLQQSLPFQPTFLF
jgi:hypothetical protein